MCSQYGLFLFWVHTARSAVSTTTVCNYNFLGALTANTVIAWRLQKACAWVHT